MKQAGRQETDALTGLGHRRAFKRLLEGRSAGLGVLLADLRALGVVDDRAGYRAGDEYLLLAAGLLQRLAPDAGAAYRVEGGRFALLLRRADGARLAALAAELEAGFASACPAWLSELGAGLATAWAADAGSLAETLARARDALTLEQAGR